MSRHSETLNGQHIACSPKPVHFTLKPSNFFLLFCFLFRSDRITQLQALSAWSSHRPLGASTPSSHSVRRRLHLWLIIKRIQKFNQERARAFQSLSSVSARLSCANVDALHPIHLDADETGTCMLAMMPGQKPRLVFGQTVALYTRTSGRHASSTKIQALSSASYISLQLYVPFSRGSWTSIACTQLGCPTFIQIPPNNVVFAFDTFKISRSTVELGGRTIRTLIPDAKVVEIINTLQAKAKQLHAAVKAHKAAMKTGRNREAQDASSSESDEDF
ncbi:hypothetical protein EXIGLDRAFT_771222 [Exidia glandulosa HHB12029]|uniref:Uncharacterized protein n=1 Tax=Exidia glandulosa HHB12029 TaxID=1314781 RepID=A0A165G5K6_EXIGL|nr:hypothetical protein EXIGLDRAFT_771222 [Exidia glandulosa HHB12029]